MKEYWYQNAIFYQVYIRAYRDSNGDGHGDLRGVIEKLDYVKELGIDCIWLMPFYPSPLKDDGYDISDYYGIHKDYGTLKDFEDLIAAAHARNLRVITDLVVNHTSDQHPWFIESRSSINSPKHNWYVWSETDKKYQDARIIFLDTERSNWTYDPHIGQYYWHRFYSSQPDLNYDNPEIRKAMLDIIRFWLEKGIDGFRVDAVPYLFEREGTNSENLPETHQYVKEMRRFVDSYWPEAVLLAEANQAPSDVRAYFGVGDEFHMAFNFPLMPRIFIALHQQQANPIREVWHEIPDIPENCQWCTFLRNHDELTLEMVSEDERQLLWSAYAPDLLMRLNLGIRRRLAPLLDYDMRRIMLANSILFSLPGTPIIYYGDEIGMGENLDLSDRNGVRTPMQWSDQSNAGFSETLPDRLYAPVNRDPLSGYKKVNVARQKADPDSLFHRTRQLIMLRKNHRALSSGSLNFLDVDNPVVLGVQRSRDKETFTIFHNLSDQEQIVSISQTFFQGQQPIDILRSDEKHSAWVGRDNFREVALAPFESVWLLIRNLESQ